MKEPCTFLILNTLYMEIKGLSYSVTNTSHSLGKPSDLQNL